MLFISVIICCYNSASRLPQTLRHLALQQVPKDFEWEVILVDNNSIDATAEIAQSTWNKYGAPVLLHIVEEKESGLIYAREKGVKLAKYEVVLFCDDDNWLAPDYLHLAAKLMNIMPEVGVIGGLGEAVGEHALPEWFDQFKENYATGPQALTSGDVTEGRGYVFGAGIVVRKAALLDIRKNDLKSILTGRKGKELTAGDDNEICQMLRLLGWKIWYEESLSFKHWLPSGRLQWKYLVQMNKGFAEANAYLECYCYAYEFADKPVQPEQFISHQIRGHLAYLSRKTKMLVVVLLKGVGEGDRAHLYLYFRLHMLLNLWKKKNLLVKLMNRLKAKKKTGLKEPTVQ